VTQWWRKLAKCGCVGGGAEVLSSQYKCICINDIHSLFTERGVGSLPPLPPYSASYMYVLLLRIVIKANIELWSFVVSFHKPALNSGKWNLRVD